MVRMGDNEEMSPPWLKPMLKANYFVPCSLHGISTKNTECNMFCLDCLGDAFCSICLDDHKDHHVLQIRKSSYHNVVKESEIEKLIDIACVQSYIVNSARIVFLNERPQERIGRGVTNTCEICCRSLPDSFRFCSLGCKLGGIKRGDPELKFTITPKLKVKRNRDQLHGHESAEDSIPKKMRKGHDGSEYGDDDENQHNAQCIYPGTAHIFDHRNPERPPRKTHRRKGIPRRAPFF